MKLIFTIVIILMTSVCQAGEISLKAGYSDIVCNPVYPGARVDGCYEIRNTKAGLLAGVGYEFHKIQDVGIAHTLEYYITGKIYTSYELYLGLGVGYLDTYMVEFNDVQADIDDEVGVHFILGKNIDEWLIEGRVTIADLDIETSLPYGTEVEKHSRFDSVIIQIGRKF